MSTGLKMKLTKGCCKAFFSMTSAASNSAQRTSYPLNKTTLIKNTNIQGDLEQAEPTMYEVTSLPCAIQELLLSS